MIWFASFCYPCLEIRSKTESWGVKVRRCLFRQVTSRDLITCYAKLENSKIGMRAILGTTSRITIVPKTNIKDIQSNLIKNNLKVLNELLNFELTRVQKRPLPGHPVNHSVKITKKVHCNSPQSYHHYRRPLQSLPKVRPSEDAVGTNVERK